MYQDSSPSCTVFPNIPGAGLTFPPPHTTVNSYAQGPPRTRPLGGAPPPDALNRLLREVVPADGAHRRRSVRARATTGGAEKVRGRLGGLPGPPRAVPHLPAGGAG